MIYLDTSVLVAYYYPEALSDVVQKLLSAHTQPAISSLCEVELMSALARKIRDQSLALSDAERIVTKFNEHVQSGLYLHLTLSEQHYLLARNWLQSFQTTLRSLDALHLAIASSTNLQLVTADKALAVAATELGVATQFLSDSS